MLNITKVINKNKNKIKNLNLNIMLVNKKITILINILISQKISISLKNFYINS